MTLAQTDATPRTASIFTIVPLEPAHYSFAVFLRETSQSAAQPTRPSCGRRFPVALVAPARASHFRSLFRSPSFPGEDDQLLPGEDPQQSSSRSTPESLRNAVSSLALNSSIPHSLLQKRSSSGAVRVISFGEFYRWI